jgi:tetratricopeptide (TPR) repeat protein
MTQCPACGAAVKPTAPTCECDESLEPWRVIANSGAALRDRGLALAADGDYLGAALALLPAALTNPFDTASLVDAARALIRLGRNADAVCWLEAAGARPGAAELLAVANERLAPKPDALAGEPAPATEAAAEPGVEPDARRPLLGGRPMHRKYGKFRGKPTKEAVAEWERVIEMEADPKRDWRPRDSAIEELVRADARAVYHYALGLGAWQAGDAVTARAEFRRCVAADPPVLNPAVYLIYVQDDQPESARTQVLAELGQRYSAAELDQCLAALRGRLALPDSVRPR